MKTMRFLLSAALMVGAGFAAGATQAQEAYNANKSVFERERPNYDAKGVPLGAFRAKPQLAVEESYSDNIYASVNNEEEDFITNVKPSLDIESEWSRHALNLYADGNVAFYNDNNDENYADYTVGADGRLDVMRETFLTAGASTAKLHEDRGDPNNVAASVEPTEYQRTNANVGVFRGLRRVSFGLDGAYTDYDYENGANAAGGVIDNNNRDRKDHTVSGQIGYELLPEYQAFIRGELNDRDYDANVNSGGFNRDSDGYEYAVGTALDLGGKTRGEVFVGYMQQSYDDAGLQDVSGMTYGGSILWSPTGLTSLRLNADRSIEETTNATASAYVSGSVGLEVEHELRRNVLVGANVSYAEHDYEGFNAVREDTYVTAGLKGKYLLNRNASLKADYSFTERDTNAVNQDYSANKAIIGLALTF